MRVTNWLIAFVWSVLVWGGYVFENTMYSEDILDTLVILVLWLVGSILLVKGFERIYGPCIVRLPPKNTNDR